MQSGSPLPVPVLRDSPSWRTWQGSFRSARGSPCSSSASAPSAPRRGAGCKPDQWLLWWPHLADSFPAVLKVPTPITCGRASNATGGRQRTERPGTARGVLAACCQLRGTGKPPGEESSSLGPRVTLLTSAPEEEQDGDDGGQRNTERAARAGGGGGGRGDAGAAVPTGRPGPALRSARTAAARCSGPHSHGRSSTCTGVRYQLPCPKRSDYTSVTTLK